MQIKDKLIENKDLVINFLLNIYNNLNVIQNERLQKIIVAQLFDTTKCWTNFGLNLLKSKNISKMIFAIMDSSILEFPENFSEMIIDSINNSMNSKVYKNMTVQKNSTPEQLSQELFKSIDLDEKKGIDLLLGFILRKLDELKKKGNFNDYEKKLFKEYGKVLASIIENYIYLFFNFDDERSEKILDWLRFFLKCKQRNLSWLFFDSLNDMREFINDFYRFTGLNKGQKIDFMNYLIDIVYGVMENCSFYTLDQKDISLLEKEILYINNSLNIEHTNNINNLNECDLESFDNIEDVNQYRLNAESVFYNIFFILIENFQDSGTSEVL